MKKGKLLLAVIGGAALFLVVAAGTMGMLFQATGENAVSWYGRIDNDLVEPITPHGGMNYRYSLVVYGADGGRRSLDLDTSRVLKDGAFIRIEVAPIRGVISWEEMQYEQLPAAVQGKYEP
ncbi:MAG: YxeA family protein [Oscillospiraceae bacterium]|jgi:uncharacterized protein (TIGR01655 family)|nr:YxeA family protein [Oscillospiraceae bacterium]